MRTIPTCYDYGPERGREMTMLGASIEDLTSFATTLTSSAGKIEAATQQLSGQLNTAWTGPDGDEFRSLWGQELRPSLARAAMTLSEASQRIRTQAREQEQTSNADGVSGTGSAAVGAVGLAAKPLLGSGIGSAGFGAGVLAAAGKSVLDMIRPYNAITSSLPWQTADMAAGELSLLNDMKNYRLSKLSSSMMEEAGKAAKIFDVAGKSLAIVDTMANGMSAIEKFSKGDYYGGADSTIGAVLSAGSLIPPPTGLVFGGIGLGWSLAQMISGDVPVTKRLVDGAHWVGDRANDAGKALGDAANQAGKTIDNAKNEAGKALNNAANETGKFVSNAWKSLWGK